MTLRVLDTPFGPLTVVASRGAVVASGFRPPRAQESAGSVDDDRFLDQVARAVAEWASGIDLGALDRVPVILPDAGFREQVWRAMRDVPPGATSSYGSVAASAGRPGAARAAGTACATNPVAPFVPCHRIVLSDGRLGGYGYGSQLKAALLEHEGAQFR